MHREFKVMSALDGGRVPVPEAIALCDDESYIGAPFYKAFAGAPIKLQAHGDPSPPLSFRNIWVRELN